MKKIKKVIALLILSTCILVGCGEEINPSQTDSSESFTANEDTTETIDYTQLKNGDRIVVQINDDVSLDAEVIIPEEGGGCY